MEDMIHYVQWKCSYCSTVFEYPFLSYAKYCPHCGKEDTCQEREDELFQEINKTEEEHMSQISNEELLNMINELTKIINELTKEVNELKQRPSIVINNPYPVYPNYPPYNPLQPYITYAVSNQETK